jgi:hypothetical protein
MQQALQVAGYNVAFYDKDSFAAIDDATHFVWLTDRTSWRCRVEKAERRHVSRRQACLVLPRRPPRIALGLVPYDTMGRYYLHYPVSVRRIWMSTPVIRSRHSQSDSLTP